MQQAIHHVRLLGCLTTHCCELVTVEDVEDFSVESDVNSQIEVLPVPQSAQLIARNPLPLDQLPLWNTTAWEAQNTSQLKPVGEQRERESGPVLHHWLHDGYGVILQVVEHPHISDSVVLVWRLVYRLFEVGVKP